jgi:heterogeneous nuclear rnp K-like protein 2
MSASPTSATAMPSTKRPLEDPSSPSAPTDQPDAKRPALDKVLKEDGEDSKTVDGTANDVKSSDPKGETAKLETAPTTNGSTEAPVDTVLPDAAHGTSPVPPQEPQPIQSTSSHSERAASHPPSNIPPQDETNWIHVRAVISSAEAATCIGKGGENVSQIRRLSGAKCTVSDYSRGAVERILTVSGQQDAIAKVCIDHVVCKAPPYLTRVCIGIRSNHSNTKQRTTRSPLHGTV